MNSLKRIRERASNIGEPRNAARRESRGSAIDPDRYRSPGARSRRAFADRRCVDRARSERERVSKISHDVDRSRSIDGRDRARDETTSARSAYQRGAIGARSVTSFARRTLFADARTTVEALEVFTTAFWARALPANVDVDAATDIFSVRVRSEVRRGRGAGPEDWGGCCDES